MVFSYNAAHPEAPLIRSEAPQGSYDAFYALAYAAYSLGDDDITGPALSNALQHRLQPPGHPIDVGPRSIVEAFELLRSGQNIDLNGSLGPMDFDPATGEAPVNYEVLCVGLDENGKASGSVDSGLVFDAKTKKFRGALQCP